MDDLEDRLRKVEGTLEASKSDLEWINKVKTRSESAKIFGGVIIAVVIGWNAFTGGLKSMAAYFIGDKL